MSIKLEKQSNKENVKLFNDINDNNQTLLSQYELYVEMADKISDRRTTANNFFVVLNSALIALIGSEMSSSSDCFKSLVCFLGILVSLFWWFSIINYKNLNSAKFKIIHELEAKLPANLYKYEWHILKEGKSKRKYWPLSHIESYIPWLFVIIFLILFVFIWRF